MRTREQINKSFESLGYSPALLAAASLEVLLDIRELLQNPPVEIGGEPMEHDNDIVQERVRNHLCTTCGTPMKQLIGNKDYGTYETQCEHFKGFIVSSG